MQTTTTISFLQPSVSDDATTTTPAAVPSYDFFFSYDDDTIRSMLADPQPLDAIAATADEHRPSMEAITELFSPRSSAALALSSFAAQAPAALFAANSSESLAIANDDSPLLEPDVKEPPLPTLKQKRSVSCDTFSTTTTSSTSTASSRNGPSTATPAPTTGMLRSVSMPLPTNQQQQQQQQPPQQYAMVGYLPGYAVHHPDFLPPWTPNDHGISSSQSSSSSSSGSSVYPAGPSPQYLLPQQHDPSPPQMRTSPTTVTTTTTFGPSPQGADPSPPAGILRRPSPPHGMALYHSHHGVTWQYPPPVRLERLVLIVCCCGAIHLL